MQGEEDLQYSKISRLLISIFWFYIYQFEYFIQQKNKMNRGSYMLNARLYILLTGKLTSTQPVKGRTRPRSLRVL